MLNSAEQGVNKKVFDYHWYGLLSRSFYKTVNLKKAVKEKYLQQLLMNYSQCIFSWVPSKLFIFIFYLYCFSLFKVKATKTAIIRRIPAVIKEEL
jgi:hypothetical protein